ncbi:MAG: hypothetical protein JWM11_2028 [Planctomycetaceae bacterium]|nr:hypothetical protein [Planctomycetaceae bacterium]
MRGFDTTSQQLTGRVATVANQGLVLRVLVGLLPPLLLLRFRLLLQTFQVRDYIRKILQRQAVFQAVGHQRHGTARLLVNVRGLQLVRIALGIE